MKRFYPFFQLAFLIPAALLLSACNTPPETPETVASKYWQFIQAGDLKSAEQLVSTESQASFQANAASMEPVTQFTLGNSQTSVRTLLNPSTTHPATDQPFSTILVFENGQWKVDATQTQIPAKPSSQEQQYQQLADDLSKSVKQNIDAIDDAMHEGIQLLNNALREGSKDMGDSFLKGMKELNESMQQSIEQMKQRREQQEQSAPAPDNAQNGEGMI